MTSKGLARTLAATAAVLMAVPSVAGAVRPRLVHKRAAALAGCRLSLIAEPRKITSGDETPQLFGKLTCPKAIETAGQTVTLFSRPVGAPANMLGTTTTTMGGAYTFVAPAPTATAVYYASAAGVTSPVRLVRVAPQVTLSGPSESKQLFTGVRNRVAFAGTVSPAAAGASAVLQREAAVASEEWVSIQKGVVGAGGVYSFVHTFVVPGDANIRVLVRARAPYDSFGASSPLSYVISQKENPALTLFATSTTTASSDPTTFGQSLTLEGSVVGGASRTVRLAARTAGGLFTTIASTTADPSGHYSFAVTPQQDTAYKASSEVGTHSTVLFEGVRYTLTASASATALQDGQALTFTGTVTPGHAGKHVYLERQDLSGSGYHVVAVAPLQAPASASGPASYTIVHIVFGTGKQVYRIKVPGDPDNQGSASAPVTVEVTPAPAATLAPGPQPPLPSEGKPVS
jgi:hypothetical protein